LSATGKQPRPRDDQQPVSEPVFHILLALANEPMHGYGILTRVEEWTAGRIRLRTATLYTALSRLCDAGAIEEVEDPGPEIAGDSRRGRVYRLTAAGRALVKAERNRLESVVKLADMVTAGGSGGRGGGRT
jgi:DNA-binding PadR family transcriptional regulator